MEQEVLGGCCCPETGWERREEESQDHSHNQWVLGPGAMRNSDTDRDPHPSWVGAGGQHGELQSSLLSFSL